MNNPTSTSVKFCEVHNLTNPENITSLKPMTIAVMGQTGSGKTALINALFNLTLKTSASSRPCTSGVHHITLKNRNGLPIWCYDLPGLGRQGRLNEAYLSEYRRVWEEADVVIWTVSTDHYHTAFDLEALQKILACYDHSRRAAMLGKLVLVITRVDQRRSAPWTLIQLDNQGMFMPHPTAKAWLDNRAAYYRELFFQPYCFIQEATLEGEPWPVISCSILLRYNLLEVINVVNHKLELAHPGNFLPLRPDKLTNLISLREAKGYSNLVIFEPLKD